MVELPALYKSWLLHRVKGEGLKQEVMYYQMEGSFLKQEVVLFHITIYSLEDQHTP